MSITALFKYNKINNWLLQFFFINLIIVYLLSFHYLNDAFPLNLYEWYRTEFHKINTINEIFIIIYLVITYVGYCALLILGTLFIPFVITVFSENHKIVITISVLLVSVLMFIIIADSFVFSLYHVHLNHTIFEMLLSSSRHEIFYFSQSEWIIFYISIAVILLLQVGIAALIWCTNLVNWPKFILSVMSISMIFIVISFFSTVIVNRGFLQLSAIFPFYENIHRLLFSLPKEKMYYFTNSNYYTSPSKNTLQRLHYPRTPIICSDDARPLNIFIILLDTWRFDAMTTTVTPHIAEIAADNLQFKNHISGGNCTKAGVFSLFYGVPATYWSLMYSAKKNPELINQLSKKHYQFGIFSSASLTLPDFATTIFSAIPNLNFTTPGHASYERDREVTRRFNTFIKTRDPQRPVFSFIFYDAIHAYCEDRDIKGPFQPEVLSCNHFMLNNNYQKKRKMFNRYLNAVNFVDQQIALVVNTIKKANLWNDSIVIITSDHGEEFNDNHLTYWGHGSNFTKYQTTVPFIMHWPRKRSHVYQHTTTHYDVVPTLLSQALNCKAPYSDYSNGTSLFNATTRYPIIVSDNDGAGYFTSNMIMTLPTSGDISVQDLNGKPLLNTPPDKQQFSYVLSRLAHFLEK